MREISVQMANGIYLDNPDRAFAQLELINYCNKLISLRFMQISTALSF